MCSLPEMINAEFLDVSYNRLRVLPDNIDQLESLKQFNCSHNQLECLPDRLGLIKTLKVGPLLELSQYVFRTKWVWCQNGRELSEVKMTFLHVRSQTMVHLFELISVLLMHRSWIFRSTWWMSIQRFLARTNCWLTFTPVTTSWAHSRHTCFRTACWRFSISATTSILSCQRICRIWSSSGSWMWRIIMWKSSNSPGEQSPIWTCQVCFRIRVSSICSEILSKNSSPCPMLSGLAGKGIQEVSFTVSKQRRKRQFTSAASNCMTKTTRYKFVSGIVSIIL